MSIGLVLQVFISFLSKKYTFTLNLLALLASLAVKGNLEFEVQ